ncbi:MAG: ferrous iron transport protein A [Thaumarchaeota archaeon]|jgi:Fe2+ transport system protein FeoA|nr:ferrous iron transport protein A [Nitrososphaerota archaeon]MCL7393989.1 ferrous iron transport protein A [Candidatus Wolframiiraptor allenii]
MRVPLTSLSEGQEAVVVEIMFGEPPPSTGFWGGFRRRLGWGWRGGGGPRCGAAKRLADLGILPGARIKVVRKAPLGGPIEIEVHGSRFMIGRGLASRIIVET